MQIVLVLVRLYVFIIPILSHINSVEAENIIWQESLIDALRFWGVPRTYGVQAGYRY